MRMFSGSFVPASGGPFGLENALETGLDGLVLASVR